MSASEVSDHYASEPLVGRVVAALNAAGLGAEPIGWKALAPLDEFHIGGIHATRQLAEALAPQPGAHVLDLGSGLGGPARLLAAERRCEVTGIDLSPQFTAVATELSRRTAMGEVTRFRQGDVTDLPFADASFHHAWTQHVAMNVADRHRFYAEVRRVLRPEGRFAVYDVVAGNGEPLAFPVPWSTSPATSHLLTVAQTQAALSAAGFTVLRAEDLTETALGWLAAQRRAPREVPSDEPGLGLQIAMGARFADMAANLAANLGAGRVGVSRLVVTATDGHGADGETRVAA